MLVGDAPGALVCELQNRFLKARLIGVDADVEAAFAKVAGVVGAPRLGLDLRVDVPETAVQQRVRHALVDLPVATMASYSNVARAPHVRCQPLERAHGDKRALSGDPPWVSGLLHAVGQLRSTLLLLHYGACHYNCLHEDFRNEHGFPL